MKEKQVRELHVVAVSEDGRHVLLAGKRGATQGGFRVALDDRLTAAVRGDLHQPGSDIPLVSDLSPKEIQSRLRAGQSAESIALAAGVPVARVERFSGPVQGEMARMIEACRETFFARGRLGPSAVRLGAAVDAALAAMPSLREDSIDWETFREEQGSWRVTVTWYARKRTREASWRYDPATKAVTALDHASAALAHVHANAAPAAARPAAAKKAAAKKAPAKKAPAKKAPARKAPAKKAPAKKAPATKAPAKKAPAKKAAPKAPLTTAARAATKARTRRVAPKPVPVPAKTRLRVVPDPTPVTRKSAAERDGVKTRATVPGWADVLLGTTPGSDR